MIVRVFDEMRHICQNCKYWMDGKCDCYYSLMYKHERTYDCGCKAWEHEQKFTTTLEAIRSARK